MSKQIIHTLTHTDSMGNEKIFKIFKNENGDISNRLVSKGGLSISIYNITNFPNKGKVDSIEMFNDNLENIVIDASTSEELANILNRQSYIMGKFTSTASESNHKWKHLDKILDKSTEAKATPKKLKDESQTKLIKINRDKDKLKELKKEYNNILKLNMKPQHEDDVTDRSLEGIMRQINTYRNKITKIEDRIIKHYQTYER